MFFSAQFHNPFTLQDIVDIFSSFMGVYLTVSLRLIAGYSKIKYCEPSASLINIFENAL